MDFSTTVVNLSILVNQGAGNYSAIEIDLPKSPMFTINVMSRNKELSCHWKRKRMSLMSSPSMSLMIMVNFKNSVLNSFISTKILRDLLKKYEFGLNSIL